MIWKYYKQTFHRNLLEKLLLENKNLIKGKTIDIGSKNRRYDNLFNNSEIIAVDKNIKTNSNISFGDVEEGLSFENNYFDSVLCLEVFEYLKNIDKALKEIKRILKPSGFALISFPFLYHEHEDNQRLTKTFLSSKLKEFSESKIIEIGNGWTVIWDILRKKIFGNRSSASKKIIFLFLLPLLAFIKIFCLDKIQDNYYSGLFIILKK
ncbi:MAG: class I SAM-dependent methyltransferase [Candidatus Pacebacteria bacterium]|nr:class I SAM-dependent methyltransferase [Candidatus Paceibacterota bacterium]